jgi:hypothetical protein
VAQNPDGDTEIVLAATVRRGSEAGIVAELLAFDEAGLGEGDPGRNGGVEGPFEVRGRVGGGADAAPVRGGRRRRPSARSVGSPAAAGGPVEPAAGQLRLPG